MTTMMVMLKKRRKKEEDNEEDKHEQHQPEHCSSLFQSFCRVELDRLEKGQGFPNEPNDLPKQDIEMPGAQWWILRKPWKAADAGGHITWSILIISPSSLLR